MTFDELQNSWKCQQNDFKLKIEPDILLREVQRNQKNFESTYFWCDVIGVGISLLCSTIFLYFGIKSGLWPLYLLAIICFWVSAFIVIDRLLQKRKHPYPSDSLLDFVNNSLSQINHQIWLLGKVLWWHLLPIGVGLIIWFGYCSLLIGIICVVFLSLGTYWFNQWILSKYLKPRKHELEELLNSLKDSCV